jgi:hypothetical protein
MGKFIPLSNIDVEEPSINLKPFLILENRFLDTLFVILGTKPMFCILQIQPHLHEN